jgi:hypothetical protein
MKTPALLQFVSRVPQFLRFSLGGAHVLAFVAAATLSGSCIPQEPSDNSNGNPPGLVPPVPQPTPPQGGPTPQPPPPAPPGPGVAQPPPVVVPPQPGAPPAPPPAPPNSNVVTLIVGDEDELSAGDEELIDLLEDLDFDVDELEDGEEADEIDDETSLVVIAESASAGQVGEEYNNLRIPVVVMNDGLLGDMRMGVAGRDQSGQDNGEELEIVLASHPIATGLNGRVSVVDDRAEIQWSVPPPGATVIANFDGDPNRASIFVYDQGQQMDGQQAPARRVFFFASDEAAEDLSNEGEQLFQNAVLWAWSGQVNVRPQD